MATDLAQQLQQVAAKAGVDTKRSKGKASLLYDSRAASDIGVEQVYDIACQGLEELVDIDPQLYHFQDTVLSRATVSLDLGQHTSEENAKLDVEVGHLCYKLVPHFQRKAAIAVLEYLVRQYKIHERHAQRTLAVFAPYHSTAEYARLVQISRLDGTVFTPFKGTKSTGATIPRPALVKCCCKDYALLDTLCSVVTSGHETGQIPPVATSFYCALVAEVLVATPVPYPDSLIQLLLPHMAVGLAPSAATSLRLATLTMAACMMTMAALADRVAVSLVSDACINVTAATLRETLQFAAAAFDTQQIMRGGFQGGQGQEGGAHSAAAAALFAQPSLLHEISRLRRENWRIEALIAALVASGAPASEPLDNKGSTESASQTAVARQYDSVVSELKRMHEAQGLSTSTVATIQQVATRDLQSTEYNAVMAALGNPVLELVPAEEKVPCLLKCLKGVSVCVMNSVLHTAGSQSQERSNSEGSFAAQWKWSQVRECGRQLLPMVCKAATGVSEWEKEIVVLVLPWLLARKWGGGGVQHIVGCLQGLEMWQQLAGHVSFSSEPQSKRPQNTAALPAVLGGEQQALPEGEAAAAGATKPATPQKAKGASKRKTRSSSGGTPVTPSKGDAPPEGGSGGVEGGGSAKKRRLFNSNGTEDVAGPSAAGASTRRILQNVQEGVAQKLLTDPNAWATMHALQEHCRCMYPAAAHNASEASRRLVTMHVVTLGVYKAWCDACAQQQAGEVAEGSEEELGKCERWILEAVCDVARSDLPTAQFAQIPAVQAPDDDDAAALSEGATVSKEHMKLLEASAVAAAVTSVRNAAFVVLAAATRPPQALTLCRRTLNANLPEVVGCVLAADPSKSSFGTSFGEVAWRLMHVQQMAFEEEERNAPSTIAPSYSPRVATAFEKAVQPPTALPPRKVASPVSVLRSITSQPDDANPSSYQSTSDLRKPIEIRPRALALLPLAVAGKFADKKLLDPSHRSHTVSNACEHLSSTEQRVQVLIDVLCALCSQSSVLRTHACNAAAGVLKACDSDSANELEKAVDTISTQICASKKALEASPDALQNVLSGSGTSGMHGLILHVLCPRDLADADIPAAGVRGLDAQLVSGVASSAVRACMAALTTHGPHVLLTMFRILIHQVGDSAAAVAAHAYVPCITMHAGELLEAGASPSGLISLAMDILRCFQKLPEPDGSVRLPDAVHKWIAAMHGEEEFAFRPGEILRVALEARPQGASMHAVEITTSIRRFTLESVLLSVWSALSAAELLDLMPAVLQSACSDSSAACRAAAQATLAEASVPLASLMAPLVATSSGVSALVATEDTSLRDKLASVLASGAVPGKRRKLAADVATGTAASAAGADASSLSSTASETLVQQLLADSSDESKIVLACMGWKHDVQGRPQRSLAKLLAAMHELLNDGESESGRTEVPCMHVKHTIMQKLVEESVPVLEALQSWNPAADAADSAAAQQKEQAEVELRPAAAEMMSALQAFVRACSHILLSVSSIDSDRARDSLNILEGAKEGAHSAELPQTAAVATYATRIALHAMLRIAKLSGASSGEVRAAVSAAVPLAAFIEDVWRLKEAAFGSMHLLLEVLVVALQGAAHSDISQVLPEIMKFTVGSSRQQDALTVATGAVSAAARAWVTTGGKAQDFLRSLVEHLGSAPATHRAAFATAAVAEVASAAKHKGVAPELSTLVTILLSPSTSKAKASKEKRVPESKQEQLSPDDAFSTLTTAFQHFAWQQRLGALQKLIKLSSKKIMQGSGLLAIQILRLSLHQVRAAGSAKAADVNSAAVQKALQGILVTTMGVQAVLVEAAKSSEKADPRQTRCIKLLRTLLTALKEPLLPASLCAGLLECLSEPPQSDCATRTALRTFSSCASMMFSSDGTPDAHVAAAQFAARAAEVAATESNESGLPSPDTQRAAAAAVAAAAAAAAQAADSKAAPVAAIAAAGLLPCLPHLASAATCPEGAVRVASLTAAGSVVVAAGASAVEHIPVVAEAALKCAEGCLHQSSSSAARHALELTAALETLTALISTVPGLLFPYLQRILAVLHHPQAVMAGSSDAVATGVAASARKAVTRHIEFRLLVPALHQTLTDAERRGTAALVATMGTLKDAVANLPHKEAVAHVDSVAEVVLKVLDVRGRAFIAAPEATALEGSSAVDAETVETATYQAMVAFILKLNENQFKKLFAELSSWARTVPSYAASATSSDVRTAACAARRATWFGLVSQLSLALRTVFTPYFEDLLEGFVEALRHQAEDDSVPLIGTKKRSKSKKRSSALHGQKDAEGSGSMESAALTARDRAVSCIHRYCMYDTAHTLSQEKYLALLAPLVARLEECGKEATAVSRGAGGAQRGALRGDEDLQDTVQLGKRTAAHLGGAAVGVIGAIVALAASTKEEALWKKTNHQVLMVSRSDIPGSRLAAIECMYNLVVRLREDYLGLLPESLRFLSELLEDSDNAVLGRSKDMVKLLEELSDENLEEFLKP